MTADLGTRIRRAMIEIADAAPVPPPLPVTPAARVRRGRRRPLVIAIAVGGALTLAATIAVTAWQSEPNKIVDSPRLEPSSTGAVSTLTTPLATTPVTTTATSTSVSTSTAASALEPTLGIMGPLPGDLQIWGLEHIAVTPSIGETSQLFGALSQDGSHIDHGLLIRTTSGSVSFNHGPPAVQVRGRQAYLYEQVGVDFSWTWVENDRTVVAMSRGIDPATALSIINGLGWRTNTADGFDPGTSSIALLREASALPAKTYHLTWYELARADEDFSKDASVQRLVVGESITYLAPDIIFGGIKQPGGFVVCEHCGPYQLVSLAPTGQVVISPQHTGQGQPTAADIATDQAVLDALGPLSSNDLAAQSRQATDRQGHLPVISSIVIDGATIEARGRDPFTITSICLAKGNQRDCALVHQTHTRTPQPGSASALLDGTWYIAVTNAVNAPTPITVTTPDGVTLASHAAADSLRQWLLFTVADTVDSATLGSPTFPVLAALARPPESNASTNPPAIPAPSNGGPTNGATTTTIDPALLRTYTVRAGDSLYVIAKTYGTTADEIVVVNGWPEGLEHLLQPGQQIKLPPAP
jgi:hypothetical protein